MPIHSGIEALSPTRAQREHGLVVLVGLQSMRIRTLRFLQTDLQRLAEAGRMVRIVTLGFSENASDEEKEHSLLERLALREGFEMRGPTAEAEVSEMLANAEGVPRQWTHPATRPYR
ncbi:MAG: hypothetical protein ACR2ID_05255 [Chthoniobacterales bacterium]